MHDKEAYRNQVFINKNPIKEFGSEDEFKRHNIALANYKNILRLVALDHQIQILTPRNYTHNSNDNYNIEIEPLNMHVHLGYLFEVDFLILINFGVWTSISNDSDTKLGVFKDLVSEECIFQTQPDFLVVD